MSAFIVSDDHIDALVTFALQRNASYWTGESRVTIADDNAEEIGRMLLDENVASVSYRYGGRIEAEEYNAAAAYRFRPYAPCPSPLVILKACDCFVYQACEHDGWDASVAKKIIDGIRLYAISALPGYDAAPWGIERAPTRASADDTTIEF